jgi:putative alpha-1,2-mannosidase
MNKILLSLLVAILMVAVSCTQKETAETDYTQFVDPYIGSDYHGHVFVGANVPFGMVQLGPNNKTQGWDWCSGYHYSDSILIGFAHTHLSGTGIGDLGDIVFMPVSDAYDPEVDADSAYNWKSTYSHDKETVEPGFYSLHIDRYNIDAELTTTERVGFHKYDFKEEGNSHLVIDLQYGTGWDMLTDGILEQADEFTVKGQRFSAGVFLHHVFEKN